MCLGLGAQTLNLKPPALNSKLTLNPEHPKPETPQKKTEARKLQKKLRPHLPPKPEVIWLERKVSLAEWSAAVLLVLSSAFMALGEQAGRDLVEDLGFGFRV